MAARKRRRRTTRRRPTRRRATRRRRRNPKGKYPVGSLLLGGLGGAAVGAGSYALNATELKQLHQGLIELGGGALLGGIAALWNPALGAALFGSGVALGGKTVLQDLLATEAATTTTTGALGRGKRVQAAAIEAPLGAIAAPLTGRKEAALASVHAIVDRVSAHNR